MALTFAHAVEAADGLVIRFTSRAIHPDAGVAWPWHHALQALARVDPLESNPIAKHFGDGLYDDAVTEKGYGAIFASVDQRAVDERHWVTTVTFTDAKWKPAAISTGFAWESAA